MPLFTFLCNKCNLRFEELATTKDSSVTCPSCKVNVNKEKAFETVAKPVIKGASFDGTGRNYIQDGDYMVGYNAAAAHQKMEDRDNLKRKIMFENNTTSLQRFDVEHTEKTFSGKEQTIKETEYAPLKGEELQSFIEGHKSAQNIAASGGLKAQDIKITKDMKVIDKGTK